MASYLDLGPCQVLFGTAGSEADLGKTQGGVRVTFAEDAADLLSDQYGTQPEDQVITGQSAEIVVPMADYTLDNLATALNQTKKTFGADEGIQGASLVGTKRTSKGNSLLLKKYVDGAVSTSDEDWIRFPEAAPQGSIEIAFDGSTQRIIETTFKAFPDTNNILYWFGNETAAAYGS
jgi:hypothetical protein